MKRLFCLLLVLCLLFTACSASDTLRRRSRDRDDDDEQTLNTAVTDEFGKPILTEDTSEEPELESQGSVAVVDVPAQSEHDPDPSEPAESVPAEEPPQTEPQHTEHGQSDAPTQTEEPEGDNLLDDFSREDWKRLNTFLSNFSEVGFLSYDAQDQTGIYDLPMSLFAFLHYKINDPSKLEYESDYNYMKLSTSTMDDCCKRFFGRTVAHATLSADNAYSVKFHNNAFYYPNGDGESYNYLTVANFMEKLPNGNYNVRFFVYALDLDEYMDRGISASYYSMTASEAMYNSQLMFYYAGIAEIRDYSKNGYQSYQLVSYNTNLVYSP